MNTLEKKLVGIGKSTSEASEALVSEAKLLLESTASKEREVLRSIGLSAELNFTEAELENLQIIKMGKENLDKEIITLNDIKKFCLEYRLYMKPAREYMGTIPATLGAELSRFCEEKNIPIPSSDSYSNFFIIAPPKMFRGYRTPIDVWNLGEAEREEVIRKRNEDPILVYKIQNGYYAIIKSWGDDFTWLRQIYGFFTRKKNIEKVNYWVNAIIFFGTLFLMWKINYSVITYDIHQAELTKGSYFPWKSVLFGLVTIFGFTNSMIYLFDDSCIAARKKIIDIVTYHERNL